jgi:hypothetical protein
VDGDVEEGRQVWLCLRKRERSDGGLEIRKARKAPMYGLAMSMVGSALNIIISRYL